MSTPARIGRYAVRRRIGSGGFATVWLAHDEHFDAPVAVKVLAENWAVDHHVRRRFLEEGRFLRKVDSPHVVTVHDAGELDDGRPYLVMAYADQGSLADRLAVGPLPVGQAVEVVRQVGSGLTALHRRGVLHRDVKPANVLFASTADDGPPLRAMLADLGLGKDLDMSSRLTMIAGTPAWVSPEQAAGEHLDARADLYALGALTHLLLSGSQPFRHASLSAAAQPGPVPPLAREGHTFAPEVEQVVARALHPDRERRWPDVASYVAALTGAVDADPDGLPERWRPADPELTQPGSRPQARATRDGSTDEDDADPVPAPAPTRSRSRALLGVAAVLALAAGGVAGAWLQQRTAGPATYADASGALEVTVPQAWAGSVATGSWTPPGESRELPAISVGSTDDWQRQGGAEGVFVGVLPGEELPAALPGHDECGATAEPVADQVGSDALLTQVSTACPGVLVERVRQVADDRFLWIQVRSRDRSSAYAVLEDVRAPGF